MRMMCGLDLNECGSLYISVKVWVTRGFDRLVLASLGQMNSESFF